MQEKGGVRLCPELLKSRDEVYERLRAVFFLDHVKANKNIFACLLGLLKCIQLDLNVRISEELKTCSDHHYSETMMSLLDLAHNSLKDSYFLSKWNNLMVVIEYTSENMSQLNRKSTSFSEVFECL
jgi:hypothetical protein